ncbi:MAG: DUF502 domain-containing protein [Candidatus Omnitrophota bacterium]|jgi:uncharacterized membrane protein
MKTFFKHIRIYVLRGILAIIPIFLSILAIRLLYVLIDKRVMALLDKLFKVRQIPGLGILLVLISLYLIGLIVSNVAGKAFFHFLEKVSQRIPIINIIYKAGKQFSTGFSGADGKQAFKKVLLVNWGGLWTVAFVVGTIIDQQSGESMLRVFVPNTPTPVGGFIFVVKESETIDPGWSVEDAVKIFVSTFVITPAEINKKSDTPR